MNLFHRWYCNSAGWARQLQEDMMPATLEGIDLSGDVLEIGPGPGMSTDWLSPKVAQLTSVEIDHKLAGSLKERMKGTNVAVVEGDATKMALPDASFDVVVSFTMLHHVPTSELQDQLLGEACRVLRPGGVFAGSDSVPNFRWNIAHLFDTRVPVDPSTFASRLEEAGFVDANVDYRAGAPGFRFRASKPADGSR